jgi:hypothetical protein
MKIPVQDLKGKWIAGGDFFHLPFLCYQAAVSAENNPKS